MGCGGESVNRLQGPFDDFCTRLPMHRLCTGAAPTDAGTAPTDAPVAATDAPVAATDAPVAATDAGRSTDTGPAASGGGCATSPAPRSGWSLGFALAALAVAARRRRARR
jgi:MYXO-CTERM domain-containing protein